MTQSISMALPLLMVAGGLVIYFMGTRPRPNTLDVPLMTNHGKMMLGGTLVFAGVLIGLFVLLKHLW